jgi:hypothetical protein
MVSAWNCLKYFCVFLIYMYLTTIGLTPGGSSTSHIYTQTVHKTQRKESFCTLIIRCTESFWLPCINIHVHIYTYSMKHSPSWEADRSLQLVKKFHTFLWNPKVRIYTSFYICFNYRFWTSIDSVWNHYVRSSVEWSPYMTTKGSRFLKNYLHSWRWICEEWWRSSWQFSFPRCYFVIPSACPLVSWSLQSRINILLWRTARTLINKFSFFCSHHN